MPVSKKQQACVNRYVSCHYDKITITVPKGDRELYKSVAKKFGLSVNQLFIKGVEMFVNEYMKELR